MTTVVAVGVFIQLRPLIAVRIVRLTDVSPGCTRANVKLPWASDLVSVWW